MLGWCTCPRIRRLPNVQLSSPLSWFLLSPQRNPSLPAASSVTAPFCLAPQSLPSGPFQGWLRVQLRGGMETAGKIGCQRVAQGVLQEISSRHQKP